MINKDKRRYNIVIIVKLFNGYSYKFKIFWKIFSFILFRELVSTKVDFREVILGVNDEVKKVKIKEFKING